MMKRIVENTHGHLLKDQKLSKIDKVPLCTSCSLGKLIARPSPLKVKNESPMFLERIQVSKNLEMRLMDIVTAYLNGSLDNDIYMKISKGFKIREALNSKPNEICSTILQRSLYGLKQSGWMWYNRLSDYLMTKGYTNNLVCPCVFIKKKMSGFVIIVVYVDDLNIIVTNKEIQEVIVLLKKEFEMKNLEKTKYVLGLQIKHMHNEIIIHQSNYTEKLLKRFNMDKTKPLSNLMVGRSLNVDNDPFLPYEENLYRVNGGDLCD
nr:putative RNA-directed DNA polymerase [Tanacetum cinerariifolium]